MPRTRSSEAKRITTGFLNPVRNMRMNLMLEKSLMPPTLFSYWSTGMRKRYHVNVFMPWRVLDAASRLSTM